jgi:hypothetical protein
VRLAARRRFFEMRDAVRQLGLAEEIKTFEVGGPGSPCGWALDELASPVESAAKD